MYVVFQNGLNIYGIGETEADAIENANKELSADEQITAYETDTHNASHGDIICMKCTDRLAEAVSKDGGMVDYSVTDGIVDLDE